MNPQGGQSQPDSTLLRLDAAAVLDAAHTRFAPGSLLLERLHPAPPVVVRGRQVPVGSLRVLAVGRPQDLDHHPIARSPRLSRIALPDHILIPGMVNAHTHLDLTHIGPQDFEHTGGFVGWVDMVRRGRLHTPDQIRAAVELGIRQSLLGGVVAVGDIAGAPAGLPQIAPFQALAASPMSGVSFIEFFAIGKPEAVARQRLADFLDQQGWDQQGISERSSVRLGLQPHATNTVSRPSYLWAVQQSAQRNLPLMTHLAETPEERLFIAEGRGPQRELLERLGVWDDSILDHLGTGQSPVAHLHSTLQTALDAGHPIACAHVNTASDADLDILSATRAVVCYCPRASAYFHTHTPFGPHRYRDMLAAGIPVALGTDSIINLEPAAAASDGPGISTLDDMRLLHQRDNTDSFTLLAMATTNGAHALALNPDLFVFRPGSALQGIVSIRIDSRPADPLHALRLALVGTHPAELLHIGTIPV